MNNFKRVNTIFGWVTFLIAMAVYIMTLEQSVSLWDCGEFISASYRLQVVHPPGAPLFLMLGRIFTMFATPATNEVAIAVNMLSAVASAATVMFTFWITTHFAKKILRIGLNANLVDLGSTIAIIGSGLVAALSVTFMDTFWFSAIEAEVYAGSSCFMALAFWAILKWEKVKDEPTSDRWIILIAYIVGLGIGLHLLNILVVPAILLYYFFNKYDASAANVIKASVIGLGSIALLQWGIIPGTPMVASNFDLFFVNTLGLPFNSGVLAFMLVMIATIVCSLMYTHTGNKVVGTLALVGFLMIMLLSGWSSFLVSIVKIGIIAGTIYAVYTSQKTSKRTITNTVILCLGFIMIGFSSYAMVVIRSIAEPAINMNDPQDAQSLLSYINREQYGSRPLVYGSYWNARLTAIDEGKTQYRRSEEGTYQVVGTKQEPVYDKKYSTILPRMGDMSEKSKYYPIWSGMEDMFMSINSLEQKVKADPTNSDLRTQLETAEMTKPKFSNNLTFLFKYQIGWMYIRYFMWNFVGRQNDLQNVTGSSQQGNWISGIDAFDEWRLQAPSEVPAQMEYNKARNTYYFLPLLLGLLGIIVMYKRSKMDFYTVLVMFLFTGLLVVIYLNQPPMEPRERDYTFAGSFQTFCVWIGLSVLFFVDLLKDKVSRTAVASGATVVALLAAPYLMGSQNWDDHDRSGRELGISFAKNYLNSCEENAILFTNGDNDTYPLWYAQNVEGVRTDVRVINLSLLPTEWYSGALRKKVFDSEALPFGIPGEKMVAGKRDYVRFFEDKSVSQAQFYPLDQVLNYITSDDKSKMQMTNSGELINVFPVKNFSLDVDKEAILATGYVPDKDTAKIVDKMYWNIGRSGLSKGDLIVLDVISENAKTGWKRPIYWTTTTGSSVYLNLDKYLRHNGLTYQLLPIEANRRMRGMDDMDLLYKRLMKDYVWGKMDEGTMHLDEKAQLVPQNLRSLFIQVADYYSNRGQNDTATAVLDKCYASIPESLLPMNLRLKAASADIYYKAGQIEKGDKMLTEAGDDAYEMVTYYKKFKTKGLQNVESEKRENVDILRNLGPLASQYNRDKLAKKYTDLFTQASTVY
jgi:hypothetical protein